MKILRNILIGLALGAVVLMIGISVTSNGNGESLEYSDRIIVSLISPEEISQNTSHLIAYGNVEATSDMDLYFEMNGVVDNLYVQPGSWVNEGDLLATLERGTLGAQIDQANAAYTAAYNGWRLAVQGVAEADLEAMYDAVKSAEELLETLEELNMPELVIDYQAGSVAEARKALEQMEAGASDEQMAIQWASVQQAQAAIDMTSVAYEMGNLRAPFSGEITTLNLEEGEYAMATASYGKILNRDNIEAVLYLSSEDANSISVGNSVLVEGEYEASVLGISSRVDEMTGKRKVRVAMNELYELTVGDSVTLQIEQDKADGTSLLNLTTVLFDDDEVYVFFYYDGAVYKKRVDIGGIRGNFVEVLSTLDEPIVQNIASVRHGQEVELSL